MSVSDWHQQQLTGMAAMMQRLGLDLLGSAPCRAAPASAIDVCRNCGSRDSCRGWLMPEDIAPEELPVACPKAQRLAELMADLEVVAPVGTRH
jgi:Family of unknown function (DUF6455)